MLKIWNLTKSYKTRKGRHYVFKNLSIEFPDHVNIGIVGPNGAGKTTFLKILGGIDFPDYGEIVTNNTLSWPLGLQGGFVRHISGRDNCKIVCKAYCDFQSEVKNKLEFIHDLSGIGDYFYEPVLTYSSGMRARLGFALSMAFDFDYFLIDEVTAVGDRIFRKIAKQALAKKRDRSNIIMVSHQMKTLEEFCDIGVLISGGEIRVFDTVKSAIDAYENE